MTTKPRFVLSYPSHPDRGRWHTIKKNNPYETECGRVVRDDWRKEVYLPYMDGYERLHRVCRICNRERLH